VTAVGVVRLYYLWPQFGLIKVADPDYSFSFCVSAIEVNLAIIAACGPALWPLIRTFIPGLRSSLGRTRGGYHQNRECETDWTSRSGHYQASSHAAKAGVTSIGLKSLKDSHGMSSGSADVERDSDEEVLTYDPHGIQRVIHISVTRDDLSQQSEGPGTPRMIKEAYHRSVSDGSY
jgi:hypothetical protein